MVHSFCLPQYNTSWTSIIPCKQSRNAHTQRTEGKGSKPAQYWPFDFICFALPGTGTIFSCPIQHQSLWCLVMAIAYNIYAHPYIRTHIHTRLRYYRAMEARSTKRKIFAFLSGLSPLQPSSWGSCISSQKSDMIRGVQKPSEHYQ